MKTPSSLQMHYSASMDIEYKNVKNILFSLIEEMVLEHQNSEKPLLNISINQMIKFFADYRLMQNHLKSYSQGRAWINISEAEMEILFLEYCESHAEDAVYKKGFLSIKIPKKNTGEELPVVETEDILTDDEEFDDTP